ncbi:MAG: hypothetical protein NZ901_13025 [Geminocystis sp.]|nr:hypothetical protein [Geminocystis sp.]MCS7149091.1 hypothetical protein [Geminocystis sp.]
MSEEEANGFSLVGNIGCLSEVIVLLRAYNEKGVIVLPGWGIKLLVAVVEGGYADWLPGGITRLTRQENTETELSFEKRGDTLENWLFEGISQREVAWGEKVDVEIGVDDNDD